jgi:hypothetical protein
MAINGPSADQIRQWGRSLTRMLSIRLRTSSDPRTEILDRFLGELAQSAGQVRILREEGEAGELPAILVSESLIYQALPVERELAPFLQLLTLGTGEAEAPEADLKTRLEQIAWPADIRIFIAPGCPHCPGMVSRIGPLAFYQPKIRISILDGILFPELSEPLGIRAVPTLVVDGSFRWTGAVEMTELLETLIHRDGTQLPASSLKTLLKDGRADQLAAMMLERGEIFPAFADLATHPEWSVRLGAVVVAEEIAEKNRDLAKAILPPLWDRYTAADVTVKGDILYLIGLAGSREEWGERLRAVVESDLPEDLRETAQDALARWGLADPA